MGSMIKKLAVMGAAFALLLSTQTVAADQCCQPTCDPCCNPCMDWCDPCGDFEVGAHALLFVPVACEYDYAISNDDDPTQVYTTKCELDWGFRVFGRYLSDCSFVGISYQWFESKVKNSVAGDVTTRAGFDADKAAGSLRLQYQNLDVRAGKYLHRACGCNFYVFGNARWVDLQYTRANRGTADGNPATVGEVHEKSETQGGALGVGTGAEFDLWCDVGLFAEANLLGVIADRSTKNVRADDTGNGGLQQASYGSQTCINPEVNFKIGLNYTYTCGCWTFVGELGYEVDYFWNVFAFPRDLTTGLDSLGLVRTCEDVGFSGLFFGGKVLF